MRESREIARRGDDFLGSSAQTDKNGTQKMPEEKSTVRTPKPVPSARPLNYFRPFNNYRFFFTYIISQESQKTLSVKKINQQGSQKAMKAIFYNIIGYLGECQILCDIFNCFQ